MKFTKDNVLLSSFTNSSSIVVGTVQLRHSRANIGQKMVLEPKVAFPFKVQPDSLTLNFAPNKGEVVSVHDSSSKPFSFFEVLPDTIKYDGMGLQVALQHVITVIVSLLTLAFL